MTTDRKSLFFLSAVVSWQKTEYPGIAKLVSRLVWEQDAAGSNPVTRTTFLGKTAFFGGFSALVVHFLSFT